MSIQLRNPIVLNGINKYHLTDIYSDNEGLMNMYDDDTTLNTYTSNRQLTSQKLKEFQTKHDEELLYLINFLDEFWIIIANANGNPKLLTQRLSQLPFYFVLMCYVLYLMYTDDIREIIDDEKYPIDIQSDDKNFINSIISGGLNKYHLFKYNGIISKYNKTSEINKFFNNDEIINNGITLDDSIQFITYSSTLILADSRTYSYYDEKLDELIKKYNLNIPKKTIIETYNQFDKLVETFITLIINHTDINAPHIYDYLF